MTVEKLCQLKDLFVSLCLKKKVSVVRRSSVFLQERCFLRTILGEVSKHLVQTVCLSSEGTLSFKTFACFNV